ncbi:hypothetical protein EBC17_11600 [Salmonella enterica subsp. enterica serovar Kottbus]|nr:hypothetical protein [Salmonella enterica subsp. enterica serovar Kottbus]
MKGDETMKGEAMKEGRNTRGLYVFNSMILLVLLALLFRDVGGVLWRCVCLTLFIGAVLYEVLYVVMRSSDRDTWLTMAGMMWFPVGLMCIPLFLGGLVRGFVMWQWPAAEVHMVFTALPYALLAGSGLSVLFLAVTTVEAILRRN